MGFSTFTKLNWIKPQNTVGNHFSIKFLFFGFAIKIMREIILKVPDTKFRFVEELIQNPWIEISEGIKIPDAHKDIVRKRIFNSNDSNLVSWKEAIENFALKLKNRMGNST